MTDKEILIKAIEKSEVNGFIINKPYYIYINDEGVLIGRCNPPEIAPIKYYTDVIFSHEFAKPFFGNNSIHPTKGINFGRSDYKIYGSVEAWKYHLSKMVLEEEPIKYLERFLND